MNIYLLTRKDYVDYDEYESFMVRAQDKTHARRLANERASGEGEIWDNVNLVQCEQVEQEGEARVLIESYNAG